jgi:hypothetical protein
LAFLGKNKKGGDTADTPAAEPAGEERSPEKASKFFLHARATQETGNHDYAMNLWLRGMAFAPDDMGALEAFCSAATSYAATAGKKGPSKETEKAAGAKGATGKYLSALLSWALKPADTANAVRAAEAAASADVAEPAYWIGERALRVIQADPKAKKDQAVKLMEAMNRIGAFDLATRAGEAAIRLDPADGKLAADVRNMSAQATMSRGGFEEKGEGGFRKNIRDAEKQKLLDAADKITKTEETIEALLEAAKADYESRPSDVPATKTYIKRLLERGRNEDEKLAFDLARGAYKATGQFSFRQQAGEIKLRVERRRLVAVRDAAEAGDEKARAGLGAAEQKFREYEIQEFLARVEAFPTDNAPKFELARRYFDSGDYQKAIPLLQKCQGEIRFRARALAMLGESFGQIGMTDPAIATIREAIAAHPEDRDDLGLQLRYALLDALTKKAQAEGDAESAAEAEKLAGGIAMQRFDYRDIQARYEQAKQLTSRLRGR